MKPQKSTWTDGMQQAQKHFSNAKLNKDNNTTEQQQ